MLPGTASIKLPPEGWKNLLILLARYISTQDSPSESVVMKWARIVGLLGTQQIEKSMSLEKWQRIQRYLEGSDDPLGDARTLCDTIDLQLKTHSSMRRV